MVKPKKDFKSVDKGLLFPFFLLITAPLVYSTWGLASAYFYVLFISLGHAYFLLYFPYIQDSNYYQYIIMKKRFYIENLRYKYFFSQNVVTFSRVVVLFSFYLLFNFPTIYPAIFPIHCIGTVIFMSSVSVDIFNIVSRPRLPDKIKIYHPLLQNRYGPITEIVINKAVPLCASIAGYAASGYLAFAGGFKALNGISEIDPIRNDLLNRYYRFPLTHKWNEMSLSAWSTFRNKPRVCELSYDRQIFVFLEREGQFVETVAKAAANLCDIKKD